MYFQDEICKEFSAQGGLDIMVQFFEYAILHGNRAMAKSVCALLRQVKNVSFIYLFQLVGSIKPRRILGNED
jgi:hypothetical protein